MPGLLLKDIPYNLHQQLKHQAKTHRRSLSSEAIQILEEALSDRAGPLTIEQIDRIRIRGRRPLTQKLLDEAIKKGRP
jgi:plasmid stability protein